VGHSAVEATYCETVYNPTLKQQAVWEAATICLAPETQILGVEGVLTPPPPENM